MTSRRSSGSSRADSAVEPTRSQNITVTCRRSAPLWTGVPGRAAPTVAEILGRQAREHFFVDLVIAERLVVTLKTKAAQPYRYFHAAILGSEERQPLMHDDSTK